MERRARQADKIQAEERDDEATRVPAEGPGIVEWVVAGVSAALVLAMIGFILYEAVTDGAGRPDLRIAIGEIDATADGYRVDIIAINRGGRTASAVTVEGQLRQDGRQVEVSEVQFDYVPADSARRGALLFTQDPRRHQLRVRAIGYNDP